MSSLITLALLSVARVREFVADMDYQWAVTNAPEMAEHKLQALRQAERSRILAAARRLPKISADALVVIITLVAAPPAIVIRFLEVAA